MYNFIQPNPYRGQWRGKFTVVDLVSLNKVQPVLSQTCDFWPLSVKPRVFFNIIIYLFVAGRDSVCWIHC